MLDQCQYLGTGFFVTRNGVALTAAHLVPSPDQVAERRLFAVTWNGSIPQACDITHAVVPDGTDLAILKVSAAQPSCLPIGFRTVYPGEDVASFGIPDESSWRERDFRFFKGYVTRSGRFIETSFAAPLGLSGSPVLCDGMVVAIVAGNHRSETLEDQLEEVTVDRNGTKTIKRVEIRSVVNFGRAEPLQRIKDFRHAVFDGQTFEGFIESMNKLPL